MTFKDVEISPYLAQQLERESLATGLVESEDGRYWFTDKVLIWRYEGQCTAIAGAYAQLVEPTE